MFQRTFIVLAITLMFVACTAGKVHLVSNQPLSPTPAKTPKTPRTPFPPIENPLNTTNILHQESFRLGTPSGVQILAITFDPAQLLTDLQAKERFQVHFEIFIEQLLDNLKPHISEIHLYLAYDSLNSAIYHIVVHNPHPTRNSATRELSQFLRDTLRNPIGHPHRTSSPFATFGRIATEISRDISTLTQPVWPNYYYFGTRPIQNDQLQSLIESFKIESEKLGLSPYRTTIQFLMPGTRDEVDPNISEWAQPCAVHSFQHERILPEDANDIREFMEKLVEKSFHFNKRLILRQVPIESSLRVYVTPEGSPTPLVLDGSRRDFDWIPATNEITLNRQLDFLIDAIHNGVVTKDIKIQVHYEVQN